MVQGRPELLLAIDLYAQLTVQESDVSRLDGDPNAGRHHRYFASALERLWPGQTPIDVRTVSRIPRAAGLGSSAAFSSALAAALLSASGGGDRARLAELAFAVERGAQGVGSPGDTSASVGGGLLALNAGPGEPIWSLTDGEKVWEVRRVRDPGWVWVVGFTGVPRSTGAAVRAVAERLKKGEGLALLDEFERVALEGLRAVEREDRSSTGALLRENHRLLVEVGVTHPRIESLLAAVAPFSEGEKLTGAGAGGSIVALPKPGREVEAARSIARAGGVPFVVQAATVGAAVLP